MQFQFFGLIEHRELFKVMSNYGILTCRKKRATSWRISILICLDPIENYLGWIHNLLTIIFFTSFFPLLIFGDEESKKHGDIYGADFFF